jgi:transcription elongation factor Elf1
MTDADAESWSREIAEARAALNKRFPELLCLRCGKQKFMLRVWPDESLVPGLADADTNRVAELICENCGFQEKHIVNLLKKEDSEKAQ